MTSEPCFIYNANKEPKLLVFFVYILVVYVNKNLNTREKIKKKYSIEYNLFRQSEISNLECNVFSKIFFILEHICLIDNVFCLRLKICNELLHNAAELVLFS